MNKLNYYLKEIFSFLKNHIFTFACIVLFCIISWQFEYFLYQKRAFTMSAISLVFVMHLFSKVRYNIIFTILFSIIVTFNFYFSFTLNTYINAALFGSIMDTNSNEATSMAKDIWKIAIPMLILTFGLVFMSVRELKKSIVPLKVSIIGLILYLLIAFPYNMYQYVEYKHGIGRDVLDEKLMFCEIASQRTAPILYGNIFTVVNYGVERVKYRNFFNNENKTLTEGIELKHNNQDILPEKIYLIVGESATRSHLSLYGYPTITTPYVDSLAQYDNNFTYYNGFSASTVTRDAFRQFLTSSSPHNMDAFLYSKSLIDMANDAGYKTVWLSPFSGMFRQHSGTYLQLLASSAQEYRYVSKSDDMEYMPVLKDLIHPSEKQLILIGLNGSHGAYIDGYDEEDEKAIPYDNSLSEMINHYNRTLHHTDRFIKVAHELVKNDSSAILIYFSDHGEIIGKGHGMNYGKSQIEIPMFTINNSATNLDSLISKYTYQHNDQKALNSLSFFYIISELLGYSVSQQCIDHALKESKYVYLADRTVELATEIKEIP